MKSRTMSPGRATPASPERADAPVGAHTHTAAAAERLRVGEGSHTRMAEDAHVLQSRVGNQATLSLGAPDDRYEREAHDVADRLSAGFDLSAKVSAVAGPARVQRLGGEGGGAVAPDVAATIHARRGEGAPLDAGMRSYLGRSLGPEAAGLRVHTDATADRLSGELGAAAFTVGSDVFFRSGGYRPDTAEGRELLFHEASHAQQQAGAAPRVQRGPGDWWAKRKARKKAEKDEREAAAARRRKEEEEARYAEAVRAGRRARLAERQGQVKGLMESASSDSSLSATSAASASPAESLREDAQTLNGVLDNPVLKGLFRKYMTTHFAVENLSFFDRCQDIVVNRLGVDAARALYTDLINPPEPDDIFDLEAATMVLQVNLSHSLRQRFDRMFGPGGTPGTDEAARNLVFDAGRYVLQNYLQKRFEEFQKSYTYMMLMGTFDLKTADLETVVDSFDFTGESLI
ncbi:MAG: DUF4157 domain-containing protein [Alphaproteobacteria bacterium]|nr:DUF4157 domain-containing protein [Alphaproteobacteria bacterium]